MGSYKYDKHNTAINPANLYSISGADSENLFILPSNKLLAVQQGSKMTKCTKILVFWALSLGPKKVTHTLQPLNHSHFDSISGVDSENNIHTAQRLVVRCTVGVQKCLK